MSRKITATAIRKAGLDVRWPLGFDLRMAALDPRLTPEARMMNRLAARYVLGNVDSAEYDVIARLQVLEGASGTTPLGKFAGKWWKKGKRGLRDAADFYEGTDIDPSWLSPGQTGMISKTLNMVRAEFNSWTKGREVHFGPDDILQNGLNGLLKGGQNFAKNGPYFFQAGHENPGIRRNIPTGKDTPKSVAGVVAGFFVQNVGSEFKKTDRLRAPNVLPEGGSVFDSLSSEGDLRDGGARFFQVLADLLNDPRSPVQGLLLQALTRQFGQGLWAERALHLARLEIAGKKYSKGALAREWGIGGGTLSKIIRDKVKPAIKNLSKDQEFIDGLQRAGDMAMLRKARLRALRRS